MRNESWWPRFFPGASGKLLSAIKVHAVLTLLTRQKRWTSSFNKSLQNWWYTIFVNQLPVLPSLNRQKRNTPIRSISLMLHIFVCNFPSAESVHQSLNPCLWDSLRLFARVEKILVRHDRNLLSTSSTEQHNSFLLNSLLSGFFIDLIDAKPFISPHKCL